MRWKQLLTKETFRVHGGPDKDNLFTFVTGVRSYLSGTSSHDEYF